MGLTWVTKAWQRIALHNENSLPIEITPRILGGSALKEARCHDQLDLLQLRTTAGDDLAMQRRRLHDLRPCLRGTYRF